MSNNKHDYGDAPVQADYLAKMTAVITTVDDFVNEGMKGPKRPIAVVVMMFPFGDGPGRCNYMSNGVSRDDLVILMKEMIARFEGQPDIQGRA